MIFIEPINKAQISSPLPCEEQLVDLQCNLLWILLALCVIIIHYILVVKFGAPMFRNSYI